ncbi:small-conductance mechanosensitive channel [Leptolyngbya sp. PCC 7375]|nr:small-conductance mechanosensitive channel [Leptolyngbya sp. PCC 7375]
MRCRLSYALITCSIVLLLASPAVAQLPSIFQQSNYPTEAVFGWRPNAEYPCGRLVCSNVYLYGSTGISFSIAGPTQVAAPDVQTLDVETRSQLVQRSFREVLRTVQQQEEVKKTLVTVNSYWIDLFRARTELHPSTPRVEVGFENDQTVVFLPAQPEYRLQQQSLVTVNEFDALHNGQDKELLAADWQETIRNGLSHRLWERSFDQRYPWARPLIMITVLLLAALLTVSFELGRSWLRRRQRNLRKRLEASEKELQQSITVAPESTTPENHRPPADPSAQQSLQLRFDQAFNPLIAVTEAGQSMNQLWINFSTGFLKEQTLLKQRLNLMKFVVRLVFWLEVCTGFGAGGVIARLYPMTRPYAPYLFSQAIWVPIIWLVMGLLDTVVDIEIDYHLNQWGKVTQIDDPNSSRVALRVSTYSPALKSATTIFFTALGIYLTIQALGINPTVLASVGAIAVVAAVVSRDVLQDMLNGAVILWTDRFVLGDVITIGEYSGLVEHMSLFTTQLRDPEGRLITIPNGQISTIANLTKDWSRIDFTIEIAYNADIKQALELIRTVADTLFADPRWQDKILEPASVLGVDHISHAGILIRVWIKTQAMQQWPVGREFRLRLKQAFDKANIQIGLPQHKILLDYGIDPGQATR